MIRKKIGVIVSKADDDYPSRMIKGIMTKAFELDYDVMIYSSFAKESTLTDYVEGEKKIFELINFDLLDGVIVLQDTLKIDGLDELIKKRIDNECKCPVVFVDAVYKDYDSVFVQDDKPFENLTDHLIEKHNCKRIFFLSGSYDAATTKLRYQGYKRSLEKHGIAYDDSLVSFEGRFWYDGAAQAAEQILSSGEPLPDAVMCCGDHMAVGAAQVFQRAGLSIPDDIIVVGYDAVDAAVNFVPSITSCSPPIFETGMNAVLKIDSRLKYIQYRPITGEGKIEIGHSCGCEEDPSYIKRFAIEHSKSAGSYEFDLFESNMMEAMASAVDPKELIYIINYFLFLVRTYKYFNLCLCDNWLDSENDFEKQQPDFENYTDYMHLWIRGDNDKDEVIDQVYNKTEIFPDYNADREKPAAFFISPVHFLKRCLGYTVLSFGDNVTIYDRKFANWVKLVANGLETMRIRTSLAGLAVRDVLTGVYSRLGLEKRMEELIDRSKNKKNKFFMIVGDVDKLK